MSNTVDGTSKIKNGTQGISDALTYAAGYAFARDIDERGASKKGPYRGDNIPEPNLDRDHRHGRGRLKMKGARICSSCT